MTPTKAGSESCRDDPEYQEFWTNCKTLDRGKAKKRRGIDLQGKSGPRLRPRLSLGLPGNPRYLPLPSLMARRLPFRSIPRLTRKKLCDTLCSKNEFFRNNPKYLLENQAYSSYIDDVSHAVVLITVPLPRRNYHAAELLGIKLCLNIFFDVELREISH